MNDTPIQRTAAMTSLGHRETSTLSELQGGRSPIQSNVVPLAEQPHWLERAWTRVREEVAKGRQAYIVCARIGSDAPDEDDTDEDDTDDEEDKRKPAAAV